MRSSAHLLLEPVQLAPAQEWLCEPGKWQFIRINVGEAYWLDASKPRALTGGELLVLPPNCSGIIRASQLTSVVLESFVFDPTLLCGFFTTHQRKLLQKKWMPKESAPLVLPSTHPISQSMAILAQSDRPRQGVVARAETLVLALKVLVETLPWMEPTFERASPAQDKFHQLISVMPDLELIQHTPEELARLCGCTPRHFNRLFRAEFGQSPRARQTEMRLLKGRALLETSQETVTGIAAECGYRNPSQFISLFRRRFGIRPGEWRKAATEKITGTSSRAC